MFCLFEIALAFHHLFRRDEVHMKSQWLWIHLLLLFSTDNWLEQWNVCVYSLWNCTPCLFSGGLTATTPPPPFFPSSYSLKLTESGACVRMTSLTLCISMCHSASKACMRIFVTIPVSVLFFSSIQHSCSKELSWTTMHGSLTWIVVFISLSSLKY